MSESITFRGIHLNLKQLAHGPSKDLESPENFSFLPRDSSPVLRESILPIRISEDITDKHILELRSSVSSVSGRDDSENFLDLNAIINPPKVQGLREIRRLRKTTSSKSQVYAFEESFDSGASSPPKSPLKRSLPSVPSFRETCTS